ncbi:ArsR/SmtB family transcription factor [Chitinimonas sp.]|uniref:ArsR/SmtB family transcription factor n=1 Tax=Chitinimonas sp. TaxID=1934313 RepID=UPI0035B17A6A
MKDGPNIVNIAALIGDHTRAEVLTTLLADRALTATELADLCGVSRATISGHLAKLLDANLLTVEAQGRHRYFRLADGDVASLLESMMGVAFRTGAVRLRSGPREPALRKARVCYDHLAGELGVTVYEGLLASGALLPGPEGLQLSDSGRQRFALLGMDASNLAVRRRTLCRPCLDWSERRHHLAGGLGAALLDSIVERGWAKRMPSSRVLGFSAAGEKSLLAWLTAG